MKAIRVIFAVISLIFIFLLIQPYSCSYTLLPSYPPESGVDSIRVYYTVVGTMSVVLLSIFGLILGYIYFQSRKDFDSAVIKQQRECSCARLFLGYLDEYDFCLVIILNKEFESQSHLDILRRRFDDIWDKLLALLDSKFAIDIFEEDERGTILEIHSFINKQSIICSDSEQVVKNQKLDDIVSEYKSRFRLGRKICISRIV